MDNSTKHIPFAVIVAATIGDEAAIQKILDFYDGYISKLSLRKLYDESLMLLIMTGFTTGWNIPEQNYRICVMC